MSATDWLCCPKCKKKFIEFVENQYGKVPVETYKLLERLKSLYENESGELDIEFNEEEYEVLYELEKNIDYKFIPENNHNQRIIETMRYDCNTTLGNDEILHIYEEYNCQHCGANWFVNKRFSEGKNNEFVDKKIHNKKL